MPAPLIRIFSDLHFGDRASILTTLDALLPLCEGATELILNGDTLDTRPSATPARTAALREQVLRFFERSTPLATLLTGNHDPDISLRHHLDPHPEFFVHHGDALFDDLVPWSQDAPRARALIAAELAALPATERNQLHPRLCAFRRAAAGLPQRHQSEAHGLKYLISFLKDTVWPPTRILRVIRAWRDTPRLAEGFVGQHRPAARFLAMGHTHRLGVTRTRHGLLVLNTGSFGPPCRPGVIDLEPDRVRLRSVERRNGEFRFGAALAEFPLAPR